MFRQHKLPWIGAFKETLSQVIFWISMINFGMLGATFYYTTLRYIWPEFRLWMFVTAIALSLVVGFIVEYKFVIPSLWAFRGKQMFGHESAVLDELKKISKRLKKLEGGKNESHIPRQRG